MAMDFRQVIAGFLTLSMFVMLANMIKTDHFSDSSTLLNVKISDPSGINVEERTTTKISTINVGPTKNINREIISYREKIKPCWSKPHSKDLEGTKGYVTLSLTGGPEYHISQITDAVVIAKYLGATLVIPDIRGFEIGQKRNFEDIYDLNKFISALNKTIKITKEVPADVAVRKPALMRVKNRISEDQIAKRISPTFESNNYIRLSISFKSISFKPKELYKDEYLHSTSCIAMFETLKFQKGLLEMGEVMIRRLVSEGGRIVAVDLKADCTDLKAGCFGPRRVARFLKQLGFGRDTVVYLTETWWSESLNPFKDFFPKTYTKDDIIPAERKAGFLKPGNEVMEKALDFYVCSESDIFVPAVSGLFYGHVSGRRILTGRTGILVPGQNDPNSDSVSDFVVKKSHLVYSCYC